MDDFLPDECDIVMEGGVTSGVVYPAFVAGLARRFRLRSIGGTSVGAVAAVAAAAAQFKRNRPAADGVPDDGFARLEALPASLQEGVGGRTRLFSLFQPCPDLQPHFAVLAASLNARNKLQAAAAVAVELIAQFSGGGLVGALVWIAGFMLTNDVLAGQWPRTVLPALLGLLWFGFCLGGSALIGALVHAALAAWRGLRRNRCGICSGLRTAPGGPPALTEWLHALVQDIAGLPHDAPLTFAQLRGSAHPIELALTTTGLSERRAHRLPYTTSDLVFRASELRALFPAEVIAALIAAGATVPHRAETAALLRAANAVQTDWHFMPAGDDLPVVVAARMSLSFPLLLQAVPLYRIRTLPGMHVPQLLRVWFSDGGLTSNFPIHFFDALLPTRPTFGVTLQDDLPPDAPPADRVILPQNNLTGVAPAYEAVDEADGLPSLFGFVRGILTTIRTWRDEGLKRSPGYRDRVVRIHHTRSEGGLNLNMPQEHIATMSASGALAAERVIERFLAPEPERNGWLNHRWVRMRSAAGVLQTAFDPLVQAWDRALVPTYEELWRHGGNAAAYPLSTAQREPGSAFWQDLVAVARAHAAVPLSERAPRPHPSLQVVPKQD
jgi:predicted acylesterase/phospholipase RssA